MKTMNLLAKKHSSSAKSTVTLEDLQKVSGVNKQEIDLYI
jgi:hypothetical protein